MKNLTMGLIPYQGVELVTALVDGVVYVAMKPIVEAMGLAWGKQSETLNKDERYSLKRIPYKTKGGIQEMLSLDTYNLPAYLYSINPNKVRKDLRETIIAFQNETFKVINEYWNNKSTFQGKSIHHIELGYKSQIAQHNNKIDELKQELHFYETRDVIPTQQFEIVIKNKDKKIKELENKLMSLPLFNTDKKLDIMLQRTNDLLNKEKTLCSFTEALRTNLKIYSEYIEALRVGGDKLEQYCINEIEKYKKEKNEAREKEVRMKHKYNDMIDRIKVFIKASNEIALLEAV